MSVNAITENGGKVLFTKEKVQVIKNDTIVLEGNKNNRGLYVVNLSDESECKTVDACRPNQFSSEALEIQQTDISMEWHRKLGHISFDSLKKLPKMSVGMPLNLNNCKDHEFCKVCIEAKQVRLPFNSKRERATKPLQIIHSDVCGPIDPPTYDGKKYFLTCVDDYTHFTKVYLLASKSEVFEFIKEYVNEAESHFNLRAVKLRCDNGGEYKSSGLQQWCKMKGIVLDYTVPYSPQLNGTAERLNRTLMDKARAMIFDSQLSKEMWGEAVLTSAYLLNRSPTSTTDTTPAEKWYNKKPDLSNLQVFGSEAYAKVLGPLKKLDSRSKQAIFVGYAANGYRLWDPKKGKHFFQEMSFLTLRKSM